MLSPIYPPTGHKLFFRDLFYNTGSLPVNSWSLNSGTSALSFLLSLLRIPPNSNVIIPAYSCPSVASAVLKAGHQPMLVDISTKNFSFDLNLLRQKVTEVKAAAVVWVNLFGLTESVEKLDVPIILDNAQSSQFSKLFRNVSGTIFSFGRGKPVNSLSGGTAVIQNPEHFGNPEKYYRQLPKDSRMQRVKYLINFTAYKILYHPILYQVPARLPWLHLGETLFEPDFEVGHASNVNLKVIRNIYARFESIQAMRKKICVKYSKMLKDFEDQLELFSGGHFYRFPILVKYAQCRDVLIAELKKIGIAYSKMYPLPLNKQPGLADILDDRSEYPNAQLVSESLLTLPINEFVSDKLINKIRTVLTRVFSSN